MPIHLPFSMVLRVGIVSRVFFVSKVETAFVYNTGSRCWCAFIAYACVVSSELNEMWMWIMVFSIIFWSNICSAGNNQWLHSNAVTAVPFYSKTAGKIVGKLPGLVRYQKTNCKKYNRPFKFYYSTKVHWQIKPFKVKLILAIYISIIRYSSVREYYKNFSNNFLKIFNLQSFIGYEIVKISSNDVFGAFFVLNVLQ